MPEYFLQPHVHWCKTDEGIVLLDLKRGKYLGIDAGVLTDGDTYVRQWRSEEPTPAAPSVGTREQVKQLLELNILSDTPPAQPTIPNEVPQNPQFISLPELNRSPAPTAADVVRVARAYFIARYQLKFWTLHDIVLRRMKAKNRDVTAGTSDQHRARLLAKRFVLARPFVFANKNHCLLDALSLVEFLATYRISPLWVFAVATKPFSAHCWVQHGDLLLNDVPERTSWHHVIFSV